MKGHETLKIRIFTQIHYLTIFFPALENELVVIVKHSLLYILWHK